MITTSAVSDVSWQVNNFDVGIIYEWGQDMTVLYLITVTHIIKNVL